MQLTANYLSGQRCKGTFDIRSLGFVFFLQQLLVRKRAVSLLLHETELTVTISDLLRTFPEIQ